MRLIEQLDHYRTVLLYSFTVNKHTHTHRQTPSALESTWIISIVRPFEMQLTSIYFVLFSQLKKKYFGNFFFIKVKFQVNIAAVGIIFIAGYLGWKLALFCWATTRQNGQLSKWKIIAFGWLAGWQHIEKASNLVMKHFTLILIKKF